MPWHVLFLFFKWLFNLLLFLSTVPIFALGTFRLTKLLKIVDHDKSYSFETDFG